MKCPCCNGSGEFELVAPVPLSLMQHRIFEIVRQAKEGISGRALVNQVYVGVKDGGPLHASQSVYVQLRKLNARLEPTGQRIVSRSRRYRLEPTSGNSASAV